MWCLFSLRHCQYAVRNYIKCYDQSLTDSHNLIHFFGRGWWRSPGAIYSWMLKVTVSSSQCFSSSTYLSPLHYTVYFKKFYLITGAYKPPLWVGEPPPHIRHSKAHLTFYANIWRSKRNKLVEMTNRSTPILKNVGDCSPNPPRIDAPVSSAFWPAHSVLSLFFYDWLQNFIDVLQYIIVVQDSVGVRRLPVSDADVYHQLVLRHRRHPHCGRHLQVHRVQRVRFKAFLTSFISAPQQ